MQCLLTGLIMMAIFSYFLLGMAYLHKFLFPLMPEGGQILLSFLSALILGLPTIKIVLRIPIIRRITKW